MSERPLEEHKDSPVHGQNSLSQEVLSLEITEQQYELPDGQLVVLGKERYAVPEFLLHPKNFGGAVVKNEQYVAAAANVMQRVCTACSTMQCACATPTCGGICLLTLSYAVEEVSRLGSLSDCTRSSRE